MDTKDILNNVQHKLTHAIKSGFKEIKFPQNEMNDLHTALENVLTEYISSAYDKIKLAKDDDDNDNDEEITLDGGSFVKED